MFAKTFLIACAAVVGLLPVTARAATQSFDAIDNGFYRVDGVHPGNGNIFAGNSIGGNHTNFFVFDLSGWTGGTVATAELVIFATGNGGVGTYWTNDISETYELFDVSSDIDALIGGTGGSVAHGDLGSGNSYGSTVIATPNAQGLIGEQRISLSLAAIADINAALSAPDTRFAVGGAVTSLAGNTDQIQGLWANSSQTPAGRIDLFVAPVPLAGAFPLLFSALGLVGLMGWRRRS